MFVLLFTVAVVGTTLNCFFLWLNHSLCLNSLCYNSHMSLTTKKVYSRKYKDEEND